MESKVLELGAEGAKGVDLYSIHLFWHPCKLDGYGFRIAWVNDLKWVAPSTKNRWLSDRRVVQAAKSGSSRFKPQWFKQQQCEESDMFW